MRVLLTNDDGLGAPGLTVLANALADFPGFTQMHVVAPADPQSAMSHAITLHRPLRVSERQGTDPVTELPFQGMAVDGRPADCVKLAYEALLPDGIDLVLSGINAGANIGTHVLYSGTVGAAREAALLGIPSIAFSLHLRGETPRWHDTAQHARSVLERLLAEPLDPQTVMNVNLPALDGNTPPREPVVVPLAADRAVGGYERTDLPDGSSEFRARNGLGYNNPKPGTDVACLFDRHITITPLRFDTTCPVGMDAWRSVIPSN